MCLFKCVNKTNAFCLSVSMPRYIVNDCVHTVCCGIKKSQNSLAKIDTGMVSNNLGAIPSKTTRWLV